MGDTREKSHARLHAPRQFSEACWETIRKFFARQKSNIPADYFPLAGRGFHMHSPVPVPTRDADMARKHRQAFQPRESWWTLFTAWLRYHSIQTRWDIERALARLLRRRWIG
jgi:hypothetical protein